MTNNTQGFEFIAGARPGHDKRRSVRFLTVSGWTIEVERMGPKVWILGLQLTGRGTGTPTGPVRQSRVLGLATSPQDAAGLINAALAANVSALTERGVAELESFLSEEP